MIATQPVQQVPGAIKKYWEGGDGDEKFMKERVSLNKYYLQEKKNNKKQKI